MLVKPFFHFFSLIQRVIIKRNFVRLTHNKNHMITVSPLQEKVLSSRNTEYIFIVKHLPLSSFFCRTVLCKNQAKLTSAKILVLHPHPGQKLWCFVHGISLRCHTCHPSQGWSSASFSRARPTWLFNAPSPAATERKSARFLLASPFSPFARCAMPRLK